MITNKMIARRVSAFGLALTGLMALVNVPTKAAEISSDYCYAVATGGNWAFALVHNYDSDNDGAPNNKFVFIYGRTFHIRATLQAERSVFNKASKSGTFYASGMNGRTPFAARIEITSQGGRYNYGNAVLHMYNDLNQNGKIDEGEPALLANSLSVPLMGNHSSVQ